MVQHGRGRREAFTALTVGYAFHIVDQRVVYDRIQMFAECILVCKLSFAFPAEEPSPCCLLGLMDFITEMLLEGGFAVEVSVALTTVELGDGVDGRVKVLV